MTTIALARRSRFSGWGMTLAALLLIELVYFSLTTRSFFEHGRGMLSLTEQFVPTGVLALGEALVILTGNIDLSNGAISSLAGIVVGVRLHDGSSIWAACALAIGVALVVGLFNGLVVSLLGIDSLLVTLATQFIATSLATSIGGQNPPYSFGAAFDRLGRGTVVDVPYDLIGFLVIAGLTILLVRRTGLGRALALIGYNRATADFTGIKTRYTITVVFVLSGLYAGVTGVLVASFYDSARPDSGLQLLLPAITMVVLGGVDIFGGRGRIGDVVVAVLLLGFLAQGLLISGRSSLTVTMVTGLVLICALVMKILLERTAGETIGAAVRRLLSKRIEATTG